jgi:hypothetical protein
MQKEVTKMTLREFYKNPMGKNGVETLTTNASSYVFKLRYEGVINRLKKKMPVKIYTESETSFYYHFLVPSDTRNMNYDVVIHFYENVENPDDTHMSLKDWNVEFFSNCPSFVFTYAFVYKHYGYFIPFLSDKLGKIVLNNKPVTKNPSMTLLWDKSIFYAIHHIMLHTQYSQRYMAKRNAIPFNPNELFGTIRTFEQIMSEIAGTKGKELKGAELHRKIHEGSLTGVNRVVKNAKTKAKEKIDGFKKVFSGSKKNSKGKIIGKPKITGNSHK